MPRSRSAADPAIRCVVLTGAGKGFCAGQDLHELDALAGSVATALEETYHPVTRRIRALEKPVICALERRRRRRGALPRVGLRPAGCGRELEPRSRLHRDRARSRCRGDVVSPAAARVRARVRVDVLEPASLGPRGARLGARLRGRCGRPLRRARGRRSRPSGPRGRRGPWPRPSASSTTPRRRSSSRSLRSSRRCSSRRWRPATSPRAWLRFSRSDQGGSRVSDTTDDPAAPEPDPPSWSAPPEPAPEEPGRGRGRAAVARDLRPSSIRFSSSSPTTSGAAG